MCNKDTNGNAIASSGPSRNGRLSFIVWRSLREGVQIPKDAAGDPVNAADRSAVLASKGFFVSGGETGTFIVQAGSLRSVVMTARPLRQARTVRLSGLMWHDSDALLFGWLNKIYYICRFFSKGASVGKKGDLQWSLSTMSGI